MYFNFLCSRMSFFFMSFELFLLKYFSCFVPFFLSPLQHIFLLRTYFSNSLYFFHLGFYFYSFRTLSSFRATFSFLLFLRLLSLYFNCFPILPLLTATSPYVHFFFHPIFLCFFCFSPSPLPLLSHSHVSLPFSRKARSSSAETLSPWLNRVYV